jgi:hypothetical protein
MFSIAQSEEDGYLSGSVGVRFEGVTRSVGLCSANTTQAAAPKRLERRFCLRECDAPTHDKPAPLTT